MGAFVGKGSLLKRRGTYSVEAERAYYARAKVDRAAVPYAHLDAYMRGSVGENFFRGKSVLDVGCGEGVYSAWIADRGGAKDVLGIELTEHRIRWDYQDAIKNLRFDVGNFLEHDFGGRQFDVVFFNLVLHHLRFEISRVGMSLGKLVAPGGRVLAFEPNVYSPMAVIAHMLHSRSANEGFLSPRAVAKAFGVGGLEHVSIGYFWRDRSWARNRLLASSFWVTAERAPLVDGLPRG